MSNYFPLFKEVDIDCGLTSTVDRLKLVEFTIPVLIQGYRFAMRYPVEESRLLALIRPFDPAVRFKFEKSSVITDFYLSPCTHVIIESRYGLPCL